MKIKKIDIIVLIIGLVIILALYLAPKQTTPRIPYNEVHTKIVDEKECRGCHGIGTNKPLPEQHPNKERCLLCHKRKK